MANSLKIVAVDSLDVVAFNAIEIIKGQGSSEGISDQISGDVINKIAVIIDAKRGQFFISEYNVIRNGSDLSLDKITDDSIISAGEFCQKASEQDDTVWLLGDGLLYYSQEFKNGNIDFLEEKYWSPKASCVYKIGWEMAQNKKFNDPITLKPNYLFRPEIRVKLR